VVERDPTCGNCLLQAPQRRRIHSLVGSELRETNPCSFVGFVVNMAPFSISSSLILVIHDNMINGTNHIV
jgi:hypothetical protein